MKERIPRLRILAVRRAPEMPKAAESSTKEATTPPQRAKTTHESKRRSDSTCHDNVAGCAELHGWAAEEDILPASSTSRLDEQA